MNFLSRPKMQQWAVMQFVGFRHADQGRDLESMVEAMGLSLDELESIKDDSSVQPYYEEIKQYLIAKN